MKIQFYEDPIREPRTREEVRFNRLGIFMHADGRRFMVGFDLTPFMERPSLQVSVTDESGRELTSLTIIEAIQTNFNLTMHLPEDGNDSLFDVSALLYYRTAASEKLVVDQITKKLDISRTGEQ
jgi:hypothetical protein